MNILRDSLNWFCPNSTLAQSQYILPRLALTAARISEGALARCFSTTAIEAFAWQSNHPPSCTGQSMGRVALTVRNVTGFRHL